MTQTTATTSAEVRSGSLRLGQVTTLLLLFGGYASLYFCRADLSVATPLLVAEMSQHGIPHDAAIVRIGTITSLGVLAYALGKLFLGGLGDFWGGRPSFLIGLTGATAFTSLFAASTSAPVMTAAWVASQLTQSLAWAGLLKVSSRWFDYSSHGTVIGILSMSYLVGDAAARHWMGLLILHGVGWRGLFWFAAAVSGSMLLASAWLLRESRTQDGHAPALPNPLNVYTDSQGQGLSALLSPLLRSRTFVLVCLLSFACTIVRETFNVWTPAYLRDYLGYDPAGAASASAVFPAVGAASVLISGWASDRLGASGRTRILCWGLAAATLALLLVKALPPGSGGSLLPLLAIGAVAFCLLGPYSYLGGALALDFGGARGAAVASGIIDGVGYLGGVLAGDSVARISVSFGWQGVFLALAGTCALAAAAAGALHTLRRAQ
jgi:OPA family glycerol-3-phosphate transporter-like MFS transporter